VAAGELEHPFHRPVSVQIARPAPSVPAFERAAGDDRLDVGVELDRPVFDHPQKTRKTIEAVRINPVAGRLGEGLRAEHGARLRHPDVH
jgi:hypothetical protein